MITEKEINEIRTLLKKSRSPLFLYDDDPDGLSSFLLLRKWLGRGKGIVVKSSPTLDTKYIKKVEELKPDRVFVLDKPIIAQEFVDEARVPVVWIDHHDLVNVEGVKYFNPKINNKEDYRPTSYWCSIVSDNHDWIAAAGIIGDWHIPDNLDELIEKYPDLFFKTKNPGDLLFNSEFGILIKIFSFALKGTTTQIRNNVAILLKTESPYEILNKLTPAGKYLYKHFERVNKEYSELLEKAVKKYDPKTNSLIFTYPSTRSSHTGALSNELIYKFPDTLLVIGRIKGDEVRISLRHSSKVIPPVLEKALEGLEGYGGGHLHACGANIKEADFKEFVDRLKRLIQK
ncbi:MAG: DHHA1 domain-containing protein [Candidatus Nanoarchaeia archaeon]|nr:DHHA1 domain-containing protein [Candidatus Nanoarchaeia archaeon]